MNSIHHRIAVALWVLACALTPLAIAQKSGKGKPSSTDVGRIAPPIGEIGWVELGSVKQKPRTNIAALRGQVIVVADYGYYCDSCVRVGVPLMNALSAANDAADLVVIPLTAGIGDDTDALIRAKGEKLGISGYVGVTDVEGNGSPYLDMNANGNLTYAFVIGRHGGIVWRGDPSRKREEYLAAVSGALHAVPCEPLPTDTTLSATEIATALGDYVLGNFSKAEIGARSLIKKIANKAGDDALRADAECLLALVEATRKRLVEALEKAAVAKDAENFQRALVHMRRAFPKGPEVERANALEKSFDSQPEFQDQCRKWGEWFELEAFRPATFPAEKEPAGVKYARRLEAHAKQAGAHGLERVKSWLADFDKASARK